MLTLTIFAAADIASVAENAKNIILAVIAGFFIALAVMYYCKVIAGKAVRLLFKAEAFSPESAKTLSELGIKNVGYHKNMLEKKNPQRTICEKIEQEGEKTRYFIKPIYKDRAEKTYVYKERALGLTVVSMIVTAAIFFSVVLFSDIWTDRITKVINGLGKDEIGGSKTDDGGFVYETDEWGHTDGDGRDDDEEKYKDEQNGEDEDENTENKEVPDENEDENGRMSFEGDSNG